MRVLITALVCVFVSAPVLAQPPRRILPSPTVSTITTNGGEVCFGVDASIPSVVLTATGTWTGTLAPRFKDAFGTTKTPATGVVSATSTTSNADISIGNIGYASVCLVATAAMTGTATITAVAGGTGSAGTAAGGSSFDGVLVDAAAGDAVTDTANDAIRVNVVAGAVGGAGGTSIADDAAFTAATTLVTPAGGVFDDTAPDSVNEGDAGALRMSANRNAYTTIRDAAGNERGANVDALGQLTVVAAQSGAYTTTGVFVTDDAITETAPVYVGGFGSTATPTPTSADGDMTPFWLTRTGALNVADAGGSLTVDGTITCTNCSGTGVAVNEDVASANADPGTPAYAVRKATPVDTSGTDGDYEALQMSAGRLWVNGSGVTQTFQGVAATDAAVSGNPVLSGGRASLAVPTDVSADGDAVPLWTTLKGALHIADGGGSITVDGTVTVDAGTGFSADTTHDSAAITTGPQIMGVAAADGALPTAVTAGDAARAATNLQGVVYTRTIDPCSGAKTVIPINIATATTTELTAALAGASNHYYVCSIWIGPTAGAQNIAFVDDDSDGCGSVTSGLAGGTTAGTGQNISANGGFVVGNGLGTIMKTNGTNRVICAVTSAAVQTSGTMTVVAHP